MLTLILETKAELLKNIDKTLMQAAVGHDLLYGVELLLRELKTNQIWENLLLRSRLLAFWNFM